MSYLIRNLAIALCLATAPLPAAAGDDGKIVLTIDGKLSGGEALNFTISAIEALGTTTVKTGTPWHDGVVTFEGVPLNVLMEHVGAEGENAAILALNNYRTDVPLSDFKQYGVILATKKNGEHMPISDKGPLFVIYPFDANPELLREVYYSRSAWQVRSITIE